MLNQTDLQKTFWKGTMIISGAALLVKVLSAFYRIPYQNIAGDLGLYVYQQVYPFYAIAFALSLYGFPLIISKVVSEHDERFVKDRLTTVFFGLSILFLLAFILLHQTAPMISEAMNDPLLITPLRMASYAFLFVPILSVARGYFQGEKEMTPTAVSQVAEQSVRVTLILLLTIWFVGEGADQYTVGSAAIFGGLVGSVVSIIVMLTYLRKNQTHPKVFQIPSISVMMHSFGLIWKVFKGGIAICITAVMFALFSLVDALQVVPGLHSGGLDLLEAKVNKGVFDRGQPLLQLGTVLATSMALPLIPFIAKSNHAQDKEKIITLTGQSLKFSFIIGGAAAVGLAVIIVPTNIFLYENTNGSMALGILGAAILFGSLAITSSAILQGLGRIAYPVFFILIALMVKAALNAWLLPLYGITAAAVTTVISSAFVACSNLFMIQRLTRVFHFQRFSGLKVLLALLLMAGITFVWKAFLLYFLPVEDRLAAGLIALSSAVIGGVVYGFALIYQKVWKYEEMILLPKGKYLAKWFFRERRDEDA
ncbi:polysaccharide biosynthesis protein [Pseudalkalibacillus sp. SCS-8]|uniref:putative polysaccharide biosynthesis protein n=1 Tax=Pseudalkalibacillus nanhaiensis TaxID=3115291 RepID=UPI0032DAE447